MLFDPDNNVVKLCAQGMNLEGKGKLKDANRLFLQAWKEATNDFEKFTAAHYVARYQKSVEEKLKWDETYPSLYLNIAKCYEDLNDFVNAKKNYQLALSFTNKLPDNGYGDIIIEGIKNGIKRVT